ncbi:MAG TPA: hypothetical protein VIL37_17005 [Natronosporangium sp.]
MAVARRDINLRRHPERWVVEAREGGPDGQSRTWEYDTLTGARTMVERCIATGGDGWRYTTDAYRTQEKLRKDR